MNIRVEIQRNPAIRGYEVWITKEKSDGSIELAKPMELVFSPIFEEPTMRFTNKDSDSFLSAFADGLARAGYKTDELRNTTEQISAIKYHLEDMRELVFKGKIKCK